MKNQHSAPPIARSEQGELVALDRSSEPPKTRVTGRAAQPHEVRNSVALRSVSKSYGDAVALYPTDLNIHEGEFLSLLGPSGCGKTTTLKLIAGFEQPTSGSVIIGDKDASTLPPHKRNVNTVFQNYALFPHMSVCDNVAYGLKQRGVGRSERRRQAMEALELVALSDRGDSRPGALSGGQQQRVALARALVLRPAVLLLDEPLGALDLKLRQHMQIELKRIHREVGLTFVFVTHDQGEALSMSDRVAVLSAGRIEQLDAPQVIYDEPATPFVASFIGEMNRLHGTLQSDGTVRVPGAFDQLPGQVVESAPAGTQVILGVRPRDARISPAEPANAIITDVMTIGHDVQIVALLDGAQEVVLVEDRHQGSALHALPLPGSRVRIEPAPGTALLLGTISDTTDPKDEQL